MGPPRRWSLEATPPSALEQESHVGRAPPSALTTATSPPPRVTRHRPPPHSCAPPASGGSAQFWAEPGPGARRSQRLQTGEKRVVPVEPTRTGPTRSHTARARTVPPLSTATSAKGAGAGRLGVQTQQPRGVARRAIDHRNLPPPHRAG